jgi:hypothetical protein
LCLQAGLERTKLSYSSVSWIQRDEKDAKLQWYEWGEEKKRHCFFHTRQIGRGTCTSSFTCACDPRFSGSACEIERRDVTFPMSTTTAPATTFPVVQASPNLALILGLSIGLGVLAVLLTILFVCLMQRAIRKRVELKKARIKEQTIGSDISGVSKNYKASAVDLLP